MSRSTLLLVEGYDDRSFFNGWALRQGYVRDESRKPRLHGGYTLRSGDRCLDIVPFARLGKPVALLRKAQIEVGEVDAIVTVLDSDAVAGSQEPPPPRGSALAGWCQELGLSVLSRSDHAVVVNSQGKPIHLGECLIWGPPVTPCSVQHSLERVAVAALIAAYPPRFAAMDAFRTARTDPPMPEDAHKFAASAMWAGWYAGAGATRASGWGGFYEKLWEDDPVRDCIELSLAPLLAELHRACQAE